MVQIRNFLITGLICFVIDMGCFSFLVTLGSNEIIAGGISFFLSTIINYQLSKAYVFSFQENTWLRFMLLSVCSLGFHEWMLSLGLFIVSGLYAKVFAIGMTMIFNFITRKRLERVG